MLKKQAERMADELVSMISLLEDKVNELEVDKQEMQDHIENLEYDNQEMETEIHKLRDELESHWCHCQVKKEETSN